MNPEPIPSDDSKDGMDDLETDIDFERYLISLDPSIKSEFLEATHKHNMFAEEGDDEENEEANPFERL